MTTTQDEPLSPLPAYAFVPGGPWPHPRTPDATPHAVPPVVDGGWDKSAAYLRGVQLFNGGYYWEAHEIWEALWHAHGRVGSTAELLKALIKLAAAGVKVRQCQRHGVVTHAQRAAACLRAACEAGGRYQLGLDLEEGIRHAEAIAVTPPDDPAAPGARVSRVFAFRLSLYGE